MIFFLKRITGRFSNKYKIILSDDPYLIKEGYKLRHRVYCLEKSYLNKDNYPNQEESDEYDPHSIFLFAVEHTGKLIGMVRLIKDSEYGFQIEKEFKVGHHILNKSRESIVEVSRLIVDKQYRKSWLLVDLVRAILVYSKKNNIHYLFGIAEDWLLKTLNNFSKTAINVLDKPKFSFQTYNYPFIINLKDFFQPQGFKNRLVLKYLTKPSKRLIRF